MSERRIWKRRTLERVDAVLDDEGNPEIGPSAVDTMREIERELERRRAISSETTR